MKKNRTMRVAVLMLALTLITCCFVGSTFAKYTSTAGMQTSVTVAEWAFEFNDQNIANVNNAPTVPFSLFDTIYNDDTNDVENAVEAGKIAPGTKGSFDLKVENTSDVAAQYKIDFDTENVPTNFLFKVSVDDEVVQDWGKELDVAFRFLDFGSQETVKVEWIWDFDGNSADDTTDGIAALTLGVEATITVEQVNVDPV